MHDTTGFSHRALAGWSTTKLSSACQPLIPVRSHSASQDQAQDEHATQKKHMHNLINRRRTSRINELINALADKVPQLHEPNPTPLPGTKDGRSKAAVLQGARLTRRPGLIPGGEWW